MPAFLWWLDFSVWARVLALHLGVPVWVAGNIIVGGLLLVLSAAVSSGGLLGAYVEHRKGRVQ